MFKTIFALALIVLTAAGSSSCCSSSHYAKKQQTSRPHYSWKQTANSLALINDGNIVWQLNYDKKQDKPYFHPLCLTDGTELTELRPSDHIWHRALWFSWKTINGLNYWEEDPRTYLAKGRSEILNVKVKTQGDKSAEIEIDISYHPPGAPPVLTEKRLLNVSAPDEQGRYTIDWQSTFTAAEKDALLDRTPIPGQPNGVAWGGYAGLSLRLADTAKNYQAVDSANHRFSEEFNVAKALWCDYTVELAPGRPAGIAILDHPANPRHPTPWYIILGQGMKYFSPALLYYEPYTLPAAQTLKLHYRVLVYPGRTDSDLLKKEWRKFSKIQW